MTNPERRLKRQRARAQHASSEATAGDVTRARFRHGIFTREEFETSLGIGSVFGVPPTPDPISDPRYVGYVQAGNEAAAGILPVEGAVGYDIYAGRYTGPAR